MTGWFEALSIALRKTRCVRLAWGRNEPMPSCPIDLIDVSPDWICAIVCPAMKASGVADLPSTATPPGSRVIGSSGPKTMC